MMVKLLTSSLGAIVVTGQVPDLREGDCVRALDTIEYEGDIPLVNKGDRGMVTGKGIAWEKRDWKFKMSGPDKQYKFQQRNAVIHRSMVEKMPETEGYGTMQDGDKCLTVFELQKKDGDNVEVPPKVQWWDCEPGWADQIFIYPACGIGPGQIRWAKDPQLCLYRRPSVSDLVLAQCEWTQPFMFKIAQNVNLKGQFKVGVTDPTGDADKDKSPECLSTTDKNLNGNECTLDANGAATSDCLGFSEQGSSFCKQIVFKGLWDSAQALDV